MTDKEFYSTYIADDNLSPLSIKLLSLIAEDKPNHVFEFGCGTGKNLSAFNLEVCAVGMDISMMNCIIAKTRNNVPTIINGTEHYLRHLCNFDVVFTVSVLDHIKKVDDIISEFKRIANKTVYLAETTDCVGPHYYSHDYKRHGFEKLDFSWKSVQDGATYHIWKCVASQG